MPQCPVWLLLEREDVHVFLCVRARVCVHACVRACGWVGGKWRIVFM